MPFNKHGLVNGHVETSSPDATKLPDTRVRDRKDTRQHVMLPSGFRTLVALDSPYLECDGNQFRVSARMLVCAEINFRSRTVMEYLLSPVQKVTHEARPLLSSRGAPVPPRARKLCIFQD